MQPFKTTSKKSNSPFLMNCNIPRWAQNQRGHNDFSMEAKVPYKNIPLYIYKIKAKEGFDWGMYSYMTFMGIHFWKYFKFNRRSEATYIVTNYNTDSAMGSLSDSAPVNTHMTEIFPSWMCEATREYWMIYRGPGCLAALWFLLLPPPLSRHQVVSLSQSSCVSLVKLTDRRGEEGAAEKEQYHTMARKPGPL